MFGAITRLFDRNFVVGYFLPATLFLCVSAFLFDHFAPRSYFNPWNLLRNELLSALGLGALVSWLLAIWLLAGNRRIIRFKEGYGWWNGSWNPYAWRRRQRLRKLLKNQARFESQAKEHQAPEDIPSGLKGRVDRCHEDLLVLVSDDPTDPPWWDRIWNPFRCLQAWRFRVLTAKKTMLLNLKQEGPRKDLIFSAEAQQELDDCTLRLATYFPDKEDELLPTAFGNTIRAFEQYPMKMYGFGSILGWCRLASVISSEFREQVDGAKAQLDFLLNLWLLSHLLLLEWAYFTWPWDQLEMIWFPVVVLISAALASYWAREAAVDWGEMIKASFDLYLPDLRKKLGFHRPSSRAAETAQWKSFSYAILYRHRKSLPELDD